MLKSEYMRYAYRINLATAEKEDGLLSSSWATEYKGMSARVSYLGQDGSDIQFAVEEFGKDEYSQASKLDQAQENLQRFKKGTKRCAPPQVPEKGTVQHDVD